MKPKENLTQDALNSILIYESISGKLFWKERPREMFDDERIYKSWNARYAGQEAFTSNDGFGYRQGRIAKRSYRAHQIIWTMVNGEWPDGQIDHINGMRDDNRIENLRPVTMTENRRNMKKPKNNTSGVIGVRWDTTRNKWQAQIRVNYKTIYIGRFDNKEDAIAARKAAEIEYGFHENHGRD